MPSTAKVNKLKNKMEKQNQKPQLPQNAVISCVFWL